MKLSSKLYHLRRYINENAPVEGRSPVNPGRGRLQGTTGGDSRPGNLPPGERIPVNKPKQLGRNVREEIIDAIVSLYEYGVTVDNRGDTVAKGVPTDSQGKMLPVAPGAKPHDTGSPNAPPTVKYGSGGAQQQQAAKSSANQAPASRGAAAGTSNTGFQRSSLTPGRGSSSSFGGGSSNPARMQTGQHNPARMQTGQHNPVNSAGGRSISPNRGVVSPAMSSMRTASRGTSGSSGWSGAVGGSNSSGSISGGASAFSNRSGR